MPLFEFACQNCDKRFTFMTGVVAGNDEPRCPKCQSVQLRKLISRVARGRSDDDRMEAVAERLETRDLDDARDLRRFAREMGKEMGAESGEDLSDELEALIEEEAGGASTNAHGDDGTIY
jgi:putative FmdB family regulatory protein